MSQQIEIMTAQEAADYLRCKICTVYGRVREKTIPHRREGGRRILFLRHELEAYVQKLPGRKSRPAPGGNALTTETNGVEADPATTPAWSFTDERESARRQRNQEELLGHLRAWRQQGLSLQAMMQQLNLQRQPFVWGQRPGPGNWWRLSLLETLLKDAGEDLATWPVYPTEPASTALRGDQRPTV